MIRAAQRFEREPYWPIKIEENIFPPSDFSSPARCASCAAGLIHLTCVNAKKSYVPFSHAHVNAKKSYVPFSHA